MPLKWKQGSSFDAITLIRANEVKDDKGADEGRVEYSKDDNENEE
jgi:hypothetical protein